MESHKLAVEAAEVHDAASRIVAIWRGHLIRAKAAAAAAPEAAKTAVMALDASAEKVDVAKDDETAEAAAAAAPEAAKTAVVALDAPAET